mgnify:CR=1 FL=1|jgi:Fe-S-cluster containining protein
MTEKFNCTQCGKCCQDLGGELIATAADIKMWMDNGREDILDTCFVFEHDGEIRFGDLWFDELTGDELSECPWLENDICLIYDFRPEVCRVYPVDKKHQASNNCPGEWINA